MDPSENSQQPTTPQRLSALYQYHNAPEVAPAHGLEYDDNVYPVSDKFPVVRETPTSTTYDGANTIQTRYTGKHAFINDNRPPRIIFGMKLKTFFVVAVLMMLVIVGAAVGGAVGGKNMHQSESPMNQINDSLPSGTSGIPSSTSTFAAATPTYTPLSDCPDSNGTAYQSDFAQGSSGDVPKDAGLSFTKYCDLSSPLTTQTGAQRIAEAFVYSFSDCIEVCAGYNFWNANSNCTVAVYLPEGSRPGNCWVGHAAGVSAHSLDRQKGTDIAMLRANVS